MKRFDQINMVPFIDIVLVLLAIVLTTASFVSSGLIDVKLPEAAQQTRAGSATTAVEIAVDSNNLWHLAGVFVERDSLLKGLAKHPTNTRLKLRIDAAADFESFLSLVDLLKLNGYANIGIQVKKAK